MATEEKNTSVSIKKIEKNLQDSLAYFRVPSAPPVQQMLYPLAFLQSYCPCFSQLLRGGGLRLRAQRVAQPQACQSPLDAELQENGVRDLAGATQAPGTRPLLPMGRRCAGQPAPAHLTMLQSVGYGGGGVQWDVEGMERGGGSACVGLRPFMSPVMAMWVPIMGTGGEKEEHIVTEASLHLASPPAQRSPQPKQP